MAARVRDVLAREPEHQFATAGLPDEPELCKPGEVQFGEQSCAVAEQRAQFLPAAARARLALALPEPVVRLAPEVARLGVAAQPAEPGLAQSV